MTLPIVDAAGTKIGQRAAPATRMDETFLDSATKEWFILSKDGSKYEPANVIAPSRPGGPIKLEHKS